jgi:diguanylate cyclase (GGDEF)-like protein/PAS domain S-box-containing protein
MPPTVMMPPTIRVLLTEDVPADAELEIRELKRAGLRVQHRVVEGEESFIEALQKFVPDVILSDFSMPGFDGMAALAIAREVCPDTPFIFVSGTIGEEYAIRALKSGATDYVLKSNLLRLPAAVERALAEAQQRRERRRIEAELDIAQARLSSIIDSLPDVLWSTALPERTIIYVGPAARQVFGREADDYLSDPKLWLEMVDAQDRPAVVEAWRRLLAGGGSFDIDYRIRRPDGALRWVNSRAHRVKGASGQERVDGVTRDISEQVEQRRRIERLSRIRELLGALNSSIVRIRERDLLFDEFCRIAIARGGFVVARIIEVDREGRVSLAATTEADPTLFRGMLDDYNRDPAKSQTLFAHALRGGEPVISNDMANDARVSNREALTREGNYSLALLPLKLDGRLAALVVLRAREPGSFDQEELGLLSELVGNMSFALELMEKQDRLSFLALYDPLTGLPNRALLHERLAQALDGARRSKEAVALAFIDLERFKAINDTLGQQTGDRVLQELARRLQEAAGDLHRVARVGPDQFALIFTQIGGAEEVARRVDAGARMLFGAPVQVDGREVRLAAKAGLAVFPDDGGDAGALVRNAEAALKRAKETGERFLFYAPEINARVSELVDLEHRLRRAVEHGELFLHFQPKYDLATRKIVGLEALMRWRGPDGNLVSPARFVPVLEQIGLIFEAGQQVIASAKRAREEWQARGLNAPRIAVNVSALQLRRKTFVADVRAALGHAGEDGGGVDLEVTESLLMTDVDESIEKLRALRALGLRMALDDFGTGYSSLAYLSKLPLDTLKIDRSFVHGMTDNADYTSIISTIISLAQALRLKVVAEGVETEQQAQLLRLLRCDQVQGFLFSKPLPAENVETLL